MPVLTEEEKAEGWHIALCRGNGWKKGCDAPYKRLDWCTPSGCRNCNAYFVE